MGKCGSGCNTRSNSTLRGGLQRALGSLAALALSGCVLDLGDPIPEGTVTVPSAGLPDAAPTFSETTQPEPDDLVPGDEIVTDDPQPEAGADEPTLPDDSLDDTAANDAGEGGVVPPDAAPPSCDPGQVACDAGCVVGDSCEPPPPPCAETCVRANAATQCVAEECTLVQCDTGWLDCDGVLDNGCEVNAGVELVPNPLTVARLSADTEAGWGEHPIYPLVQPCGDCGQDFSGVPEQPSVFEDEAPAPSSDLVVGASLAWGDPGISLRVVVFDDDFVVGISAEGESTTDARVYDHLHFVFDGGELDTSTDSQDHHLFLGLDGTPFDQRIPDTEGLSELVGIELETVGAQCRVLRARLTRDYLRGGDDLTLASGTQFGIALSYNDFDHTAAEPSEIQREHNVFLSSPGPNYVYGGQSGRRELPRIELVDTLTFGLP